MPFYQFNSFTGRLKPVIRLQPLYPISPRPLQKESVIIYDTINTKPVRVTPAANYCTDKPPTLDSNLWAKYKHYQATIDKPIHLVNGKRDLFLYRFIMIYVAVGCMQSLFFILRECFGVI